MKKGTIRRRGRTEIIGTWRADQQSLVVETEDADLRKAADEILKTPQTIPVCAPEHYVSTSFTVPVVGSPAKLKYLALFALEMDERGFEVEPSQFRGHIFRRPLWPAAPSSSRSVGLRA